MEAAALAKANGVTVYTIVLASRDVVGESVFGQRIRQRLSDAQMKELTAMPEAIAKETGGRFFLAGDGDALRKIYGEIDDLEKVDVGEIEFTTYREWFALPLIAGIMLLVLAQALEEPWLRRTP
jgi:Ca-activated chloride channel family protein